METFYPSLKKNLRNASVQWVDHELVLNGHLITCRKLANLPAFNTALIDARAKVAPVKDAIT